MDGLARYYEFLALHKPQLRATGIPQQFWQSLYRKLSMCVFDAGDAFRLMLIDYDGENEAENDADDDYTTRPVFTLVVSENDIKVDYPGAIYLVDHAWTYRMHLARQHLELQPHLTDRLCTITGVDLEHEDRVEKVLRRLWKYCQAYSIVRDGLTDDERAPIWYMLDEVGSAVNHSDEPNFRIVPFMHLPFQTSYSVLFPMRDCVVGEKVMRDFVEHIPKDSPHRPAYTLPWQNADLRRASFVQTEPDVEYFTSGHVPETYPQDEFVEPQFNNKRPLKVYAEYDVVRDFLKSPYFVLVEDESDADILWLTRHFKQFAEFAKINPNRFVNQFPFEYVITIKDLLSIICRRASPEHHNCESLETYPSWLPTTYNLATELLQFASYYQHREAKGLDNHWIIKPWNLARGLDILITDNIKQIVRLETTGPKIAQKYIDRPVLFYRADIDGKVKFDMRYVLLLKCAYPLVAYVHRKFFLRFANRAFSLDNLDDYEKHFTVMNYQDNAPIHHIKCDDFLNYWKKQYPSFDWAPIDKQIRSMLYEVLKCSSKVPPPCGIASCPQSRALYAADIMLEWSKDGKHMQPKLLEINWTPDCKRACDYYPEFFNDVFNLLFRDQTNDCFKLLSNC